jgi:hypothetical protein
MTMIQLFSIGFSLCFTIMVFYYIYKARLKEAYALIWVVTNLFFLGLSLWQDGLNWLSKFIGIYYPPAALFLVLFGGVLLILLQFSCVLSRRADDVKKLSQRLALLEEKMSRAEKGK